MDPSLVAGFAAEARSHLPQIQTSLAAAGGGADTTPEKLGEAKRRVESMRDASSMMGLDALGRALELIVRRLEAHDVEPLAKPFELLDDYLVGLEESPRTTGEPTQLLDALLDSAPDVAGGGPAPSAVDALDAPSSSAPSGTSEGSEMDGKAADMATPDGATSDDVALSDDLAASDDLATSEVEIVAGAAKKNGAEESGGAEQSNAEPSDAEQTASEQTDAAVLSESHRPKATKSSDPAPLPMPSWVTRVEAPRSSHPEKPKVERSSLSRPLPTPPSLDLFASTSKPETEVEPPDDLGPPPTLRAPASPPAAAAKRPTARKKSSGPSAAVREIFAAESDEHAQAISKLLDQLSPHQFVRDVISNLRRRVHNLKGSAALVKLDDLSQVAHGMEDLLDIFYEQSRGPSPREISALVLAGDALQALIYDRELSVEVPAVMATLAEASTPGESPVGPMPERSPVDSDKAGSAVAATGVVAGPSARVPGAAAEKVAAADRSATREAEKTPPQDQAPEAFAPAPATAPVGRPAERRRYVRVSVDALDEAMRLLVEVDAERHLLRSLIARQKDHAVELDLADRRLHREVRALETDLEVAALGGAGLRRHAEAADPDSPFDALELDRYSELHERSRSLIESAGDLGAVQTDLGGQLVSMDHSIERLEGTAVRLRDRLLGLRLVPFSSLSPRLEGVVRLAARTARKEARLQVEDGGVELDRDVLDALVDPLDHLLRNAVAHGIETPEGRDAVGKPETGVVRLTARYDRDGVELVLSDDGAGIKTSAVSRRAVERGLRTEQEVRALDEAAVRELIFEPGLSTAEAVDQLAGRGVGMDVVRQRLEDLRGRLTIEESSARGTAFKLRLPTTLAVQRVLLVTDGGHRLALPSPGLERLERINPEDIEILGGKEIVRSHDEVYSVIRLAQVAGFPALGEAESRPVAIFSRLQDQPTIFLVDSIQGGREVVVQDLGRHLGRRRGLLGVTQVGSGHPVPILDPVAWTRGAGERPLPPPRPAAEAAPRRRDVLVVDDSLSMRRYLRRLVERFGFVGVEARDGQEAVDLLDDDAVHPSVILLDLEMPRMDGFELMAALRADARFSHVPRAVLTSRDAVKHRNRAYDAGADAYLVKPVAEEELEKTLQRLIQKGDFEGAPRWT
ncbi:MAG: response regulator [Acidobacteriota bacterium]